MEIQPYKLIPQSELDQIEEDIANSVNNWKQSWLANDIELSLSVTRVNVKRSGNDNLSDIGNWLVGRIEGEDALIGLYRSDGLSRYLGCQFHTSVEDSIEEITPLAERVKNRKLASLIETVLSAYYPTPPRIISEATPDGFFSIANKPGCGFIEIQIKLDEEFVSIVLDYKIIQSKLNTRLMDNNEEVLQSAISAFGDTEIIVDAYIGEASLDISSLSDLSPGDILKLDTAIDKPVDLRVDGKHLCSGSLGHLDGAKAIKIMK